ncbi:MAG: restriction endonuclease subunit S [Rhodocyclaceae bacterium]|jgi:type I restriction enzyme S subunit|nr:restriction endonuclease subunit S [Rhodocyclaceae bacterium]MCA3143995.1 restriction endonuclease subunit S [Rhodocyclaceae bacterium]
MSSKTKTGGTQEEATPALVPKLRFPEFRGAKAWALEPMGEIYSFKGNNSLSRDKLNYVAGSVKNIHYGDIHTKFSTHFDITKELVPFINESEEGIVRDENLCAEGDMIFADASEDMADIGKSIEIVSLNGESVVSGLHTVLARRRGDRIALGFGGHLFKSGWVRTQIQKEAQGAKVLGISANRMRSLRLPIPNAEIEQQKIAECLSSADELIAAQARKVDALKTQKNGLMQQLFPREGETQPRVRFPEFQNDGEWKETRLGQLGELVSGLTYSPDDVRESGLLVLRSSNVQDGEITLDDNVYVDPTTKGANLSRPNDILICIRNGSKALIGKSALIPVGMPLCTHGAFMTVFRAETPLFAFQLFQTKDYRKQVAGDLGATINSINGRQLLKYKFVVPKPAEQQRIASCLSSLDARITAETQKLETLKTHKKGLMQQLFPSPEEVEA